MESKVNSRLEAFCDGVFAIALTLLIIDIKIPSMESIGSSTELWRALRHLGPEIFALALSFIIILITWVNHHGMLKLVRKSSPLFIYANGFLLLTVVFIPFPTSLLGAFIRTDHATPAVVLYNAVLACQAIGWILMSGSALKNRLVQEDHAVAQIRKLYQNGCFACGFYSLLALAAVWFPISSALITTASWIFWLVLGIRMKHV